MPAWKIWIRIPTPDQITRCLLKWVAAELIYGFKQILAVRIQVCKLFPREFVSLSNFVLAE